MGRQLDDALPGSSLITRRLCEVLFIQVIAAWVATHEPRPGWVEALRDPHLGKALALLHEAPQRPWTAGGLGTAVGLSRSALFDRFTTHVGMPPMAYLAAWRMTLAADSLARSDASITEICDRVGYRSVPSFTKAFRRHHGVTPAAYRRTRLGR